MPVLCWNAKSVSAPFSILCFAIHCIPISPRKSICFGNPKSGNFTNCIRVFPYAALQFASYERYKSRIVDYCEEHNRDFGFVERLLSGACAGVTAATLTYPLDVMRVRQAVYDDIKGISSITVCIYCESEVPLKLELIQSVLFASI